MKSLIYPQLKLLEVKPKMILVWCWNIQTESCHFLKYASHHFPHLLVYMSFSFNMYEQVLSMSRLGAAGAVAQLVADVPLSSALEVEKIRKTSFLVFLFLNPELYFQIFLSIHLMIKGESIDGGSTQPEWEKWSNDGTEQQVAKLMEEDIGAAMQFLQSKALCIMPISLASAIYRTRQPDAPAFVKPESSTPS